MISNLEVKPLSEKVVKEKETAADAKPASVPDSAQDRRASELKPATGIPVEIASESKDNQLKPVFDEEVDVEILPPINMPKVIEIKKSLDAMPDVGKTQMIPVADKPVIRVLP